MQVVNEDLDARYIRGLLQRISAIDCEILDVSQPEKLLISSLLVPPVSYDLDTSIVRISLFMSL